MATAIRAIPTLYGETAKSFESEAECMEQNPGVLFRTNNRTGCRFLIVDALNRPETLHYYEKNGFRYLIADKRLEAKYMGIGVGRLPLNPSYVLRFAEDNSQRRLIPHATPHLHTRF